MALLAHFLPPVPVPIGGHGESLVQAANPANIGREQPAQQVLDQAHNLAAPVAGQIRDAVSTVRGTHVERIPELVLEETRQVTAYIDRYVHIPWLHGEQRVTGG